MTIDTNSLSPVESLLAPVRHSTHPYLTWYAKSGERVELSGRVFDNWVAKSANLLHEEFDLAPGSVVATDMPGHWKSAALALACWHLGAEVRCVAPGTDPGDVDVFITADPQTLAVNGSVEVIAVPLPALAMAFGGPLPVGATDYASEVRSYADSFNCSPIDTAATALHSAAATLGYTQLFAPGALPEAAGTTLLSTAWPLERILPALVSLWSGGYPVVLVEEGLEISKSLLEGERVVTRLDQES
ncbi:TIGR03089 family protein [Paeniglutamicibacter sp. ABSL32-1]|uniref:TIGR03089 family protein n=1 Tax=Paeniglutamicibacter quisquiliarum TaxID=2849498 RepID=UPI001C2D1BF0|nr:TIGR03089 family protein [Paeniglutamicibacter quisquiliarum]MBV1779170.1 TIGR03089 family protein [Paeniglutamicibacter quisquiliarum]